MTKYKWHKDFNPTYEDGFAHGYEAHRAEQALEQPAQKPVLLNVKTHDDKTYKVEVSAPSWQGLSDDEIDLVWFEVVKENNFEGTGKYFARAIEQELKTKNGFSGLKEKNNAMQSEL